jgi:RNA polymerase sigma factor (sigma-70 family)
MAPGGLKHSGEAALPSKTEYEQYAAALNRYLVRRVNRPEDVQDLTQEIFELFVKRSQRPEVVRDPLAYLFRIAFHVVGSSLAVHSREKAIFDARHELSEAEELLGFGSSSEEVEAMVAQRDVQAALAQLPKNYLTALMLIEGEGMSYKEAAQASGFTPGTIATYVTHGRAALKLALEGRWKSKRRNPGRSGT